MTRAACRLAFVLSFAVCAAGASAGDYVTELAGPDSKPESVVNFSGTCGEECYAASLSCEDDGRIGFIFGDIEFAVAAKAASRRERDFSLKAGGVAYSFSIMELAYGGEMNNTWIVTGYLESSRAPDFRKDLINAKTFTAKIAKESLTLPVSEDVKAWAAACKG